MAIVVALIDLNNINILSIPSNYISTLTTITMAAAVIITIISGIDYFVKNKEAIKIDK